MNISPINCKPSAVYSQAKEQINSNQKSSVSFKGGDEFDMDQVIEDKKMRIFDYLIENEDFRNKMRVTLLTGFAPKNVPLTPEEKEKERELYRIINEYLNSSDPADRKFVNEKIDELSDLYSAAGRRKFSEILGKSEL